MSINRRTALTLTAGAAAGLLPIRTASAQQQFAGKSVTFATWGGEYETAQKKSYVEPFERKTGAKVVVDGPVNAQKVRVMLETKNYDWHAICVNQSIMLSLAHDGLLNKVDASKVDLSKIAPAFRYEYGPGIEVGSFTLSYSKAAFEGRKAPQRWEDLFDLKNFPGKRMLYNSPQNTLEVALLADGVPKDKLYPLDVERAFKKLDTIKDRINFFQTHAQLQQFITDGAVSCGYMYANRAFNAMQKGAKIDISWEDNLRSVTPMIVPKGVQNTDIAWAFINEMLDPQNQAMQTNQFISAPTNLDALKFVKDDILPWLPTSGKHLEQGFEVNAEYWGTNLAPLTQRWQAWLLT